MKDKFKTREELVKELQEVRKELDSIKALREKNITWSNPEDEPLSVSEENFRSIFENNSAAGALIEPDTTISMVNEEYCNLSGYTKEDVIGKSWTQQIPPQDLERLKEYNRRRLINPKDAPDKYEFTFYRKNGEIRHSLMSVTMLSNQKIIASFIDITERKQAEDLLQQTQLFLYDIIEHSPNSMWISDEQGNAVRLNQACRDLFKLKDEEVIGTYNIFKDNIVEEQGFMPKVREVFENGSTARFTIHYDTSAVKILKLGRTTQAFFEVHISPILNSKGKVTNAIIQHVDITEQKQAEEKLRESKNIIEGIINIIPAGVFWKDKNLNYLGCNLVTAIDAGFSDPKEVIGKNDFQMAWHDRAESYRIDDLQVIESESPKVNIEEFLTNAAGETVIILTTKIPLKNSVGEVTGLLGTYVDITKQKHFEEKILKSEARYRNIINISPVPMALNDEQENITLLNPAFIRTFGYSQEEIPTLANWWPKAYPDLDYRQVVTENWQSELQKSKQTGAPFTPMELKVKCKNGTDKIVLVTASSISNAYEDEHLVILYDITERKQAEEKIMKSEAQLANALDIALLGPWEYDVATDTFTFNDYFYNVFRTTVEREGGYTMTSAQYARRFVHPDDMLLVGMETRKAIETTDPNFSRDLEHRIFYADGELGYINVHFFIIKDAQGQTIKTYGVNQDITERKKDQESLKASEQRYHNLFENVQDVFYQIDLAGIIQDISPSIKHFSEFSRDEIIGTKVSDLYFDQDDRELFLNEIKNKGEVRGYELTIRTKSGKKRFASINASLIADVDGKPNHIDGALRDITERKLAEDKIREKDIQFRKLSSNLPDLIFQFSRKPDGTYCVPIASEGIKNIFGCSPEDVLDDFAPIGRVIFPEDAERVISEIEYSAKHLTYFTCEFRVQIPGKPIQWIFSRSTPEKLADGSITWYGFNANITEMKQTEMELVKAKEKAEESDRLKSTFLANMSHEIRTPMNGILGFAGLLKEQHLSGEEQQNYISIIEKSGKRMLNIIGDIVSISKIESGQMEVSINETDINEQIEFIDTFFRPEVEKKGIRLLVTKALPANECHIKTDREKIYAILTNIVGNALKYTHAGSIKIGVEKKGDFLEFFVKDTGKGVPENQRKIIFERFRQSNDLITEPYEGAGLGLSISKAYVEMLGGEIWLESELGKGSAFYFTIPYNADMIAKPSIIKGAAKTEADQQVKKLKILIAEDDEDSASFLSTTLQNSSREILTAGTGFEAVEACRNNPDIDLILMDIRMPELDGYSATQQIRQFNKDVIIIAQTAFAMTGDREKAIAAGCNDHLSKPVIIEELRRLMQQYLSK